MKKFFVFLIILFILFGWLFACSCETAYGCKKGSYYSGYGDKVHR